MKNTLFAVIFAALLSVSFTACSGGGAKSSNVQETRTTTTGQELMDLEKAHNAGIITDKEYAAQKKKILNQ